MFIRLIFLSYLKMFSKKEDKKKSILRIRNSRKVYLPVYFMVLVLVGVIIYIKLMGLPFDNYLLLIVGAFILLALKTTEIHRLVNLYEINPNVVVHSFGLFSKRVQDIDMNSISDIRIHQTLWQRMLNYGDVVISLFAHDNMVRNIDDPSRFVEVLEKTMANARREN